MYLKEMEWYIKLSSLFDSPDVNVNVNVVLARYTALCLHFQLDTGYTIIPFNKCEEFYLRECSVDINDPELINVKLFFLVNMLVW